MSEARQIQSMIDFIEREAQEKAEELDAAAQEEYDVEKMRLVEAEKTKIRANAEKKRKQVDVNRRVARANYSKMQRLRVMEERAKIMEQLHEQTRQKIMAKIADPSQYKPMLISLIHQSLLAIRTDTIIQCRQEDAAEVGRRIQELEKWYKDKTGASISIQTGKTFLNSEEAWGGIVAVSTDGRIVCNNTLSYRTKTCFDEQLPTVRFYLFNPKVSA
ncbi:putative ATP synthase [Leptomonas seymouri]|uniref:Putative ATP synthase n=1 Tax=Leptomonas seymouri TaxID=5684 RepID=A0A0N1I680_LEPSE|nr:putative ATP synthase [Leptomonas seymouri]|eukprot:KPI88563.1 putative ATP synthase [Leptomonas seymouri]